MTVSPRWSFERDEQGRWRWTRSDRHARVVSTRSFRQHTECVLDAIRYALERRRAESNSHSG